MDLIVKKNTALIKKITFLIEKFEQLEYSSPLEIYNGSSIGEHFRHIFDFYKVIVFPKDTLVINYANRTRDLTISNNPTSAITAFETVIKGLQTMDLSKKISFVYELDENKETINSSLERELYYVLDHAIHHLAIIKIGINTNFSHIEVDSKMGVAPSTLKYKAKQIVSVN